MSASEFRQEKTDRFAVVVASSDGHAVILETTDTLQESERLRASWIASTRAGRGAHPQMQQRRRALHAAMELMGAFAGSVTIYDLLEANEEAQSEACLRSMEARAESCEP